jgi:2-polyprenyl-6-methoxyphenol hydroxylase-like FAD-dependent oxidoreductase
MGVMPRLRDSCDDAEFVFGDSVAGLRQDEGGVDVRFERSAARRFGLVIGADGLHSAVRRLAFGPEADYVRHMGLFRRAAVTGFDYRDTGQHKRLLFQAYEGGDWRVPELLEQVRTTQDLYFDSVSQMRLRSWSRGRVALLGDAAACVSLFGEGSTSTGIIAPNLTTRLWHSPPRPSGCGAPSDRYNYHA